MTDFAIILLKIKKCFSKFPVLKKYREDISRQIYEKQFSGNCWGCFRGVYSTFEEAIATAPQNKSLGYDNDVLAEFYKKNILTKIFSYDYPIMFWLNEIMRQFNVNSDGFNELSIFDFGGCVGNHYYTYVSIIDFPVNLKWVVCDVEKITNSGKSLAVERKVDLDFTTEFSDAEGKYIFLASGSIQYIESLSGLLRKLNELPRHVLINRVPLYPGKQYVTLQNGGSVYYPSYVFNRNEFIGSIQDLGYELVSSWEDYYDKCIIPFYPEYSVKYYSGLYFRLVNDK